MNSEINSVQIFHTVLVLRPNMDLFSGGEVGWWLCGNVRKRTVDIQYICVGVAEEVSAPYLAPG